MTNLYEVGRVCVKTMGREAGSYCVVVEETDDKMVVITGPKHLTGVKRRGCSTRHLEPLDIMLSISKGADDEAVEKAIEEATLTDRFRTKIRLGE
ncbi:MAG: 50S ribosomal protein L14e [Candidatus Thorarchaeota archaeon]